MKVNRVWSAVQVLLAMSTMAMAQADGITLKLVDQGFQKPVYYIPDPLGRHFLVEQEGRVRIFIDGRAARTPYLDITDRVFEQGECGLLSVAFHPKFATNGRLFVNYTRRQDRKIETIISEFKADVNAQTVDKETEKVVLKIDQPYANHNGGLIKFGPDGMLYIGMGDGGSGGDPKNHAQNRRSLLGKMLRIDVNGAPGSYAVPKDNPFVGKNDYAPEIWATGLRNPWRFSFDRETGTCFAGDVGQNKYEEVDVIVKGGNYGWRIREAAHDFKPNDPRPREDLIDPIAEYGRDMGISITGGYVYRGKQFPQWKGVYFYGDFASGRIWGLKYEKGKVVWQGEYEVTRGRRTGKNLVAISSFGEDKDGELYITHHGGDLYKMEPTK